MSAESEPPRKSVSIPPVAADAAPRAESPRRVMRTVVPVIGLLVVIGALAGVKGAQIATLMAFGKHAAKLGPPPEAVGTVVAHEQVWDETLRAVGSVAAGRGVSICNDAPGLVWRIQFDSGATVRAGQVLVELDTRVERAQLASARARQSLAATNVERTRALVESGAIALAQRDNDEAQFATASADANALAAQIERKLVRAPFAGKLGIRLINVGQYLAPGTPITVLESAEATYVDFALPQQDRALVAVGMPVRLALDTGGAGAVPLAAEGAVLAVEPVVDVLSRNIRVRASMSKHGEWLRPGTFVNVAVVQPKRATVVAIPSTALVHASFGDSVFIVEDEKDVAGNVVAAANGKPSKVARQQFVRLGPSRGDFVAIANGVKAGQEIVATGAFKLRNRTRVAVNDDVKLRTELEPHPDNR